MDALVLGGGACLWDDLRALGPWHGLVIAVNEAGVAWAGRVDHWVTLHPEKLARWKAERADNGGNADYTTWSRTECPEWVDRTVPQWDTGSSGMLAVSVAYELGCERVVLCGVPMDHRPHFFDRARWDDAPSYRDAWVRQLDRMRGRVTSMSGYTRELLGPPAESNGEAADD